MLFTRTVALVVRDILIRLTNDRVEQLEHHVLEDVLKGVQHSSEETVDVCRREVEIVDVLSGCFQALSRLVGQLLIQKRRPKHLPPCLPFQLCVSLTKVSVSGISDR